jgi:TfoX/Sxy family transcriptional regulator of competence genes
MPREMPKFTKTSPEVVEQFGAAIERLGAPDVTLRKMFGYQCAWIGGNMTTGLFGDEWWVRVSEPERDEVLALGGHPFAPMPGKSPMGRYVVLPDDVLKNDATLDGWLTRSVEFTRTLPPKK